MVFSKKLKKQTPPKGKGGKYETFQVQDFAKLKCQKYESKIWKHNNS